MNEDIYKQHILDLNKNPHNKEEMFEPDVRVPAKNASCGDSYILYLKVEGDRIPQATFSGIGCAVSQAAASMLTDKLRGMTFDEARTINEDMIYSMLGVEITAGRQKCALLLFKGLEEALRNL